MELITSAQRDQLFEAFEQDAFHLELRDDYTVPNEESPFASWLRGEPDDLAWAKPWSNLMRRVTAAGKTVRRVRVITEPHTPYITWEHSLTALNEEDGEDIRWLPRRSLPGDLGLPLGGKDWWLFDGRLLAVGHFDDDGRVLGSEIVEAPDLVAECVRVRDLLWSMAVPHREYKP
ncbi:hypothetical protein M1P56_09730 [Streptomyces sp. HU2014]|uniref:DUF6879 family protein n=1 Tax=Streptomyces sp. HU2014 TaxID=2939414 RepID=UPI00200C8E7B|nr:DUF6879 family protein [Streptomyces sp. HU2014]UQI44605.1 hypothetical protein M1P56_09730 [Streptomyces sp. HU2014]